MEIEETILVRVYAVPDPAGVQDADYLQGLRAAVTAAVDCGFGLVEGGEERSGPIPEAMRVQARQAARRRVELETVLRRYFAGFTSLGDFVMQEASRGPVAAGDGLYRLQRELAALFDRIVASISAEYREEAARHVRPPGQRLVDCIRGIIAGELVDTSDLDYDFGGWHLGAIAVGPEAARALDELAGELDRRRLLVDVGESTVWAWFGGRREFDEDEVPDLIDAIWSPRSKLVVGEPAQGLRGWRLTHRQARSAAAIAARCPGPLVRYGNVAILAGLLRDDDLVRFLADTYLAPLAAERDGGRTLLETLHAYFAACRNTSSAAAALGVSRQAVNSRLRAVERRLGCSLERAGLEIQVALQLADVASPPGPTGETGRDMLPVAW